MAKSLLNSVLVRCGDSRLVLLVILKKIHTKHLIARVECCLIVNPYFFTVGY